MTKIYGFFNSENRPSAEADRKPFAGVKAVRSDPGDRQTLLYKRDLKPT